MASKVGAGLAENSEIAMFGPMLGVGAVIVLPIFYGCIGFVGGAIGAALYNVFAAMVGGVAVVALEDAREGAGAAGVDAHDLRERDAGLEVGRAVERAARLRHELELERERLADERGRLGAQVGEQHAVADHGHPMVPQQLARHVARRPVEPLHHVRQSRAAPSRLPPCRR